MNHPNDPRRPVTITMLNGRRIPPPVLPMSALIDGRRCPHCRYEVTISYGTVGDGRLGFYALCDRCRALVCKDSEPLPVSGARRH